MSAKPLIHEGEQTLRIRAELQATARFTTGWSSMYASAYVQHDTRSVLTAA
jgi:hypothetical protein